MKTGDKVRFNFTGYDGKPRTGTGEVFAATVVGIDAAYTIIVAVSPNYKAGEYVDVRARHLALEGRA